MLNKSISLSAQVNKLKLKSKIIYTWAIPHLDDYGLISNDQEVIKAMVVPMIKDIEITDINEFILDAEAVGLTKEWSDCIEFLGFENHQSITAEKRAKCHFSKNPKNPQENFGENKNPQESPVQEKGREVKRREDKGREGVQGEPRAANAATTPQEEAKNFFIQTIALIEKNPQVDTSMPENFMVEFCEKYKTPKEVIWREIQKFTLYWTEKNKSGTKERWEIQKTFEVKRRLFSWFSNIGTFQSAVKKKTLIT